MNVCTTIVQRDWNKRNKHTPMNFGCRLKRDFLPGSLYETRTHISIERPIRIKRRNKLFERIDAPVLSPADSSFFSTVLTSWLVARLVGVLYDYIEEGGTIWGKKKWPLAMTSCKTIPKSHEKKKKNLWAKLMAFFFTLPAVKMQYIFFSVQRIVFLSRQFRMQHTHSVMSPLLLFKKKKKKQKKKLKIVWRRERERTHFLYITLICVVVSTMAAARALFSTTFCSRRFRCTR